MFVCLSSGASPRYRQDILRAMAMPNGARLQFRYDAKWISPTVRDLLSKNSETGTLSLIAHIDQNDKTKPPDLIPCRFAALERAMGHGSTFSLVLTLGEFCYAEDIQAFNTEMKKESAGKLPAWKEDGSIAGFYWLEIGGRLTTAVPSESLASWEKIVGQLAGSKDFTDESCFYMIDGLYPVGCETPIAHRGGYYQLDPKQQFELRLYHFHPKKAPTGALVRLDKSGDSIHFTTSPLLSIDSRYDMKFIRFKTARPSRQEDAILSVYRADTDLQEKRGTWQFDLSLRIKGSYWATIGYGVVLGILLAGPHIVAALSDPGLPQSNVTVIVIVSSVLGLLTGVLAAFGIKKSVSD